MASNSGAPQSGQFHIIIDNEVILVSAGYGGLTWTVARAQESSVGATHASGATVSQAVTAGALLNLGPSGSFTSITTAGAVSAAAGTFTGAVTAPSVASNYAAGGITVGRYLGTTAGVAPTGGPYNTGDWTFDSTYPGVRWLCTAGGSPGTWKATGTGCYAEAYYAGAGQSIANNNTIVLNYDTAAFDNYSLLSNAHAGTGAKSTYTCPLTGLYMVTLLTNLVSAAYTDALGFIYKNGASVKNGQRGAEGTDTAGLGASVIFACNATDYIQGGVYQTSGGARNTVPGQPSTYMQVQFVGAQ